MRCNVYEYRLRYASMAEAFPSKEKTWFGMFLEEGPK